MPLPLTITPVLLLPDAASNSEQLMLSCVLPCAVQHKRHSTAGELHLSQHRAAAAQLPASQLSAAGWKGVPTRR
jgi:hypothetical protein